jgi:exodeoxyribonuclease VII large subunit
LTVGLRRQLERRQLRIASIVRTLDAVGPSATLARGYAIVQRPDGGIVTGAAGVGAHERLRVRLSDGALAVEVLEALVGTQLSSTSR